MYPSHPKMLTAALTLLLCPALSAAPYSDIIAFGDSLTDSGQYPDGDALQMGAAENRRFTNRVGPTFSAPEPYGDVAIQHVSRALGLGELNPSTASWSGVATGQFSGTNYALGGAKTDQILSSIIGEGGSKVWITIPDDAGIPPQYQALLQESRTRNGYLYDNPVADRDALFYINGGANDIFAGQVVDAESAANSAENIARGVSALYDAGARYIMVSNIPELDGTALYHFGARESSDTLDSRRSEVLGPLSRLYNTALYKELAASKANIIHLDVATLLLEAQNSPEKFGFASATTCFNASNLGSPCIEDPDFGISSANPDPRRLLFNDGIHPTTAAQEAIADYTLSILSAPSVIAMLPVFGLQVTQTDIKRQQSLLSDTRGLSTIGNWQLSMAVEGANYSSQNRGYDAHFAGEYAALSVSGQRRIDEQWRWGAQLGAGESTFKSKRDNSFADIENVAASLFLTYDQDRYFANAIVQLDRLRYATIYRHTPIGADVLRGEEGDSKGTSWAAATEVGYDLSYTEGNWRYGPRLELYAANSQVDGYREYSATATALSFFDQSLTSQQADLGVFASFLSTDKTLSFTGKIGLASEFDMDGDDLQTRLQSNDLPSFYLPGYKPGKSNAISSQAVLSYSPSALSRIAIRYQSLNGEDRSRSLAASATYHF